MLTEEQADELFDLIDEGELHQAFARLRRQKVKGAALLEDEFLATGLANRLVNRLETLVSRSTLFDGQQPLNERLRNECNRETYVDEFDEAYEICYEEALQSFVMHGVSHQLPEVLFKRIFYEFYLDEDYDAVAETIQLPGISLRRLKKKVFAALFKKFGVEPMREKHNVENLLKLPVIRNKDYVLINFEIESRFWDKASKFVEAFSKDFLQQLSERNEPARFVFFWSVIYKEDAQTEKLIKRRAEILKALEKLKPNKVLPELSPISSDDLGTWISVIETQANTGASKLYNLLEDEFQISQKEAFTMREALRYFDFIKANYKSL